MTHSLDRFCEENCDDLHRSFRRLSNYAVDVEGLYQFMNIFFDNYRDDAVRSFRSYKKLAERAFEQVNDAEFFTAIDEEANSIAVIVKHIAGNLRSRWSYLFTTDGEKPDRNRDTEFEMIADTRESLMLAWEKGWAILFDAIEPLTEADLEKTTLIRSEPHTIVEAMNRQLTHYSYHVGQIVLLAKHFRSSDWKSLSVPKNRSAEFNKYLTEKQEAGEMTGKGIESAEGFAEK